MNRKSTTENILQEADRITGGDRKEAYGKAAPMLYRIVEGWALIFKNGFTPWTVVWAMLWFKCVREEHKHGRDNLTDIAGYARVMEKFYDGE